MSERCPTCDRPRPSRDEQALLIDHPIWCECSRCVAVCIAEGLSQCTSRRVDWLTRADDLIERAAALGPLQRAGAVVITPSGTVDLRTFTGDLMSGLESAMAALERRKIFERTQAGKERVYARGGKPHGLTPYGLRYDREAGWSIDPDEAAIVREIVRRVGGEESCIRIALDLAARSIPPPGRQWGHSRVRVGTLRIAA